VKARFERLKPHCNVGTIGHVDHGKTTLTAAITRCLQGIGSTVFKAYSDIDNHVEERVRGITINAAHIEYETEKRHYSHIDCPGHQQYVKNMLTGAVQMEGAILVVSVNDGVQVQTREHVILAKEVGIKFIVVYINKLDSMLEPVMQDLVELEVRELLESYGYPADLPVIKGSARLALNEQESSSLGLLSIKKLMEQVDTYIKQPERLVNVPFLLAIEQTYVITGRGTVVTGKVEQGVVKITDNLEVIGNNKKKEILTTTCLGLEMFRKSMDYAEVGDNVGVLIKGIKKDQVRRGFILAAPGYMKPYKCFVAKVYVLTGNEGGRKTPFLSNFKPQFFFRTANITGTVILDEGVSIAMPGDSLTVKINLIEYAPLNIGLRFIFRESHTTVGAGYITEFLEDNSLDN
jgi:elongation factor Tu